MVHNRFIVGSDHSTFVEAGLLVSIVSCSERIAIEQKQQQGWQGDLR